jgi:ABC-type branched-subunit amino acid transport system substrate-binding protein
LRTLRPAHWLIVLSMALAGCASLFEPTATREEQQAYDRAEAARSANPAAARKAFEEFLSRYPDSALAPEAELELAAIARAAGKPDEAKRRYADVVKSGGPASDRARVQLATLEIERGDAAAARQWLDRVRLSRLEGADLRNAYRALAESSAKPTDRVRWLAMLRGELSDASEVSAVDAEIDHALADLSVADLDAVARQVGDRPPGGHIYIALAERALVEGDRDTAQEAWEKARKLPVAPRYAARLAALESRLGQPQAAATEQQPATFAAAMERPQPDYSAARGAIGVVLPLTGQFAGFGESALEGVLLAAGVFDSDDGARHPDVRVMVRDSGSDPERAAAAVRELAADPEVVAIVGPLVSATCEAAAREAESARIPLLALTTREEVTNQRHWIFRMRTRPREEAQALAERAIAMGAHRFAILYPNDPYGVGLRGLFWDAVESRGGRVVAVSSFDPKATDFAEPIRHLVGYTLLDSEEKALLATREEMLDRARKLPADAARELRAKARTLTKKDGSPIPPIVDFDALFIPASHEDVVLIAPQLAYQDVTGPRLLGAEGWYDDQLVKLGGEQLEGSLFAAHFYPDSQVPYVHAFTQRFESHFGSVPEAFAAQGYDAASLVLIQLAHGRSDREEVRDGLHAVRSYPGMSGVTTILADGNAEKRPYLLGIQDGHLVHYTD